MTAAYAPFFTLPIFLSVLGFASNGGRHIGYGVPIRLTGERWFHIVNSRDELAGREEEVLDAVRSPDWVTRGYRGSLIAWRGSGPKRFLVVII